VVVVGDVVDVDPVVVDGVDVDVDDVGVDVDVEVGVVPRSVEA